MERLLRFLGCRMARVVPPTPGSSDGDEPQLQVRDELWLGEATNESNSAGPEVQDAKVPGSTVRSGPSSFCRIHGRCHRSESAEVRRFLRAWEQWLSVDVRVSEGLEANGRLDEDLNKVKRKGVRAETDVNLLKKTLGKKTVALKTTTEALRQARQQCGEWEALYFQKEQERKDAIQRASGLQEQVAQLQGENLWLRQQLRDAQNKAAQEPVREVARLAETSLAARTQQHDCLKQENPHLPEDLDKVRAKVCELSAQLELQSQTSLQLKATMQELQELVAPVPRGLATPGGVHIPTALRGKRCEQPREEQLEQRRTDLDPNVQRARSVQDLSDGRLFRREAKPLGQSRGRSGSPSGSVTAECGAGSAGDPPRVSPAFLPNADEVQDSPSKATLSDLDSLEEELLDW